MANKKSDSNSKNKQKNVKTVERKQNENAPNGATAKYSIGPTGKLLTGRPKKSDVEIVEALVDAFSIGCNNKEACAYAGIPPSTFYYRMARDREFGREMDMTKARLMYNVRKIAFQRMMDPQNKDCIQYLSKRYDNFYGDEEYENNRRENVFHDMVRDCPIIIEDGEVIFYNDDIRWDRKRLEDNLRDAEYIDDKTKKETQKRIDELIEKEDNKGLYKYINDRTDYFYKLLDEDIARKDEEKRKEEEKKRKAEEKKRKAEEEKRRIEEEKKRAEEEEIKRQEEEEKKAKEEIERQEEEIRKKVKMINQALCCNNYFVMSDRVKQRLNSDGNEKLQNLNNIVNSDAIHEEKIREIDKIMEELGIKYLS